jgi:hypothetical protein
MGEGDWAGESILLRDHASDAATSNSKNGKDGGEFHREYYVDQKRVTRRRSLRMCRERTEVYHFSSSSSV